MHFAMVAKLWGCDGASVACCGFSPECPVLEGWISRMRSQWHFRNQIIVLLLRPAGAILVKDNFHHSGGNIFVQGSSAEENGGAVLESSSGVAGDGSGCLW